MFQRGFLAFLIVGGVAVLGGCMGDARLYDPLGLADEAIAWSCEVSSDCPGAACDPVRGICVDCLVSSDCPDRTARCEDQRCVTGASPRCLVDTDCQSPSGAFATVCVVLPGACDVASGACRYDFAASGSVCDDGDPCTEDTRCDGSGACVGRSKSCDDGDPCTTDRCEADGRCGAVPLVDGSRCGSAGQVCRLGACVCPGPAEEDSCNDGVDNDCDGRTDCEDVACRGRLCDDGDQCTTGDECLSSGQCGGGVRKQCLSVVCSLGEGTCDPASGACRYSYALVGTACDDGNPSTSNTRCSASGACEP